MKALSHHLLCGVNSMGTGCRDLGTLLAKNGLHVIPVVLSYIISS